MFKTIIVTLGCCLLLTRPATAQQQTIRLRIKNSKGYYLNEAQVMGADSTLLGTTADDGSCSIAVSQIPLTILIKRKGYETRQIVIRKWAIADIVLQDGNLIDEVSVFGYRYQKSDQAKTFDIVGIDGTKLTNTFEPNPMNALRARVPGMQMTATAGGVTAGSGMIIRGMKSIMGGNQPLFVLDGIPIENETSGANQYGGQDWGNALKELTPFDIENVQVLKSAAAVSRYGSRGMNGVIEIKTKGENEALGFHIETNIGSSFGHSYHMPQLLGQDAIRQINDSRLSWLSTASQNYLNSFETAQSQLGNVALSYANTRSKYRLSYTADYNKGTYRRNTLDKNNLMFKGIHNWAANWKTEMGIIYNNSISRNAPSLGAQKFASLGNSFIEYPIDFASNSSNDPLETETAWYLYGQEAKKTAYSVRTYLQSSWQILPALSFNFGGSYSDYNIRTNESANGFFERLLGNQSLYHQQRSYRNTAKEYTRDWMVNGEFHWSKTVAAHRWDANLGYDYWQTEGGIAGTGLLPTNPNAQLFRNGNERAMIATYLDPQCFSLASQFDVRHANNKAIHGATASVHYQYTDKLYISGTGRLDNVRSITNLDRLGNLTLFYPTVGVAYFFDDALRNWLQLPESFIRSAKLRANIGRTGNVTGLFHYQSAVTDDISLPYPALRSVYKPYYTNSGAWGFRNYQTGFSYENAWEYELGTNLSLFQDRIDLGLTWYSRNISNNLYDIISPLEQHSRPLREVHAMVQNRGWEILLRSYPLTTPDFTWSSTINFAVNRNRFKKIETSGSGGLALGSSQNDVSLVGSVNGSFGSLYSSFATKTDPQGRPILNAAMEYAPSINPVLIGDATPKWIAGFENSLTYKGVNLSVLLDIKMGGDIYSGTYALLYQRGVLANTAFGRTEALGGVERKMAVQQTDPASGTINTIYRSAYDGIIPQGVFDQDVMLHGQVVGGLTFEEAQQKIGRDANGEYLLQPLSASDYYSGHHDRAGVRNESVFENSFVALREVTIGYNLPPQLSQRWIGARHVQVGAVGRNLGYLYQSLPFGLNPDGAYNNRSSGAFEYASLLPVRTFGLFFKLNF